MPDAVAILALLLSLPPLCMAWQPPPSGLVAQTVRWAMGISPHLNDREPGATEPEVGAIRRSWSGGKAELKSKHASTEVWVRPLFDGAIAVAAFNKGERPAQVDVVWKELGIAGQPQVRDALLGTDMGKVHAGFAVKLPAGGAALYRVLPASLGR